MAVVNYALTLANSEKKNVSATYLNNMKIDDKGHFRNFNAEVLESGFLQLFFLKIPPSN